MTTIPNAVTRERLDLEEMKKYVEAKLLDGWYQDRDFSEIKRPTKHGYGEILAFVADHKERAKVIEAHNEEISALLDKHKALIEMVRVKDIAFDHIVNGFKTCLVCQYTREEARIEHYQAIAREARAKVRELAGGG